MHTAAFSKDCFDYLIEMGYTITHQRTNEVEMTNGFYKLLIGHNWIQIYIWNDDNDRQCWNPYGKINHHMHEMGFESFVHLMHAYGVVTLKQFLNKAADGQGLTEKRAIYHLNAALTHLNKTA